MADSPKHIDCKEGEGQFYRIAGSMNFKCRPCGEIKHFTTFHPMEFEWKAKHAEWAKYIAEESLKKRSNTLKEMDKLKKK